MALFISFADTKQCYSTFTEPTLHPFNKQALQFTDTLSDCAICLIHCNAILLMRAQTWRFLSFVFLPHLLYSLKPLPSYSSKVRILT